MPTAAPLLAFAGARASGGRAIWRSANSGFRNESVPGTLNSLSGRARTTLPMCLPRRPMATPLVSVRSLSEFTGRADEPHPHRCWM
eukprot:3869611-Alexandrium_andersonii.AAC.1